jgi:dTDP-4-dehydrorhamnose 3,5-epimerase
MPYEFIPLALPGAFHVKPRVFHDHRGYFFESYKGPDFTAAGIDVTFVQDNISYSKLPFTVRALHFQTPPFGQAKLLSVLQGRVLDVIVDIRTDSPTFGQHVVMELSADEHNMIYAPVGMAHGFCTLEPDTKVMYKVSAPYSPQHDGGILWSDPALQIAWPCKETEAHLSDKDKIHPQLKDFLSPFRMSEK